MATTLEIANQALIRVGAEPITALTDSNERARAVNASWDFVRREVLRAHSWNVATTRALLKSYAPEPLWEFDAAYTIPSDCLRVLEVQPSVSSYDWRVEGSRILVDGTPSPTLATAASIASAPTAASPVNVEVTSHGLSTGDVVKVASSTMTELNDRFFQITVSDVDNFTLDNEDGTGRTTGTGGTVAEVTTGDLRVRYVADLTAGVDGTFDAALEQLLVVRLAIEIVERVTDSTTKREALVQEYGFMFDKARSEDGEEQSDTEFAEDSWVTARY